MPEKLKRIFTPPPLLTLVIVLLAAALLSAVLAQNSKNAIAYFSYLFSTYALVIGVRGFVLLLRQMGNRFRSSQLNYKLHRDPRVAHVLNDPVSRAQITLFGNVIINAVYIVVKLVSGICFHSNWLIAFAFYYLLLTGLRASLVHYVRRHRPFEDLEAEYRRLRFVGVMLLSMNLALVLLVSRMVGHNEAVEYPGALIYAMAAYAFYAVILSLVQVIRFRKLGSPVITAIKIVNFTAALVSMLSLEAAMLARFGNPEDRLFRGRTIGITGFVICLLIVMISVIMIIRATKEIHRREIHE